MLTAVQYAQMQADQLALMPDTCDLLSPNTVENDYGEQARDGTYTTLASAVPCGFVFSPFKFRSREVLVGAETSEILVRVRVPLTYVDTVDQTSVLRLTHRHGTALTTPELYEVQGFPERGPTAMILNLKRVEI